MRKIISGGQTGVDRGALEAAIALGLIHGGWCPKGRRAEDGEIPARYQLTPTESPEYAERTGRNVADSDGTLVLCQDEPAGGTALTCQLADRLGKPCQVVSFELPPPLDDLRRWLVEHDIQVLNVAGPRESQHPRAHEKTRRFLTLLLG